MNSPAIGSRMKFVSWDEVLRGFAAAEDVTCF
jgi:hypothetical protein